MKKPFIIAEIAQGYEGSEKLVELYVKAVAATGADAIKFQIFLADESALPDYKYYDLYKSLELSFDVWRKAIGQAHKKGMQFYIDALELKTTQKLFRSGVDGFKIHATNINNMPLIKAVGRMKKTVLLSTGGCALNEINRALDVLSSGRVILMHGFQAEPTACADNHLNRIRTLKEIYGLPIGFQDHTEGDSELARLVPFVALGAGATLIEKHLTLSRRAEIEDYVSALTPEEFKDWARQIRRAFAALGMTEWKLTAKEILYKKKVRRAVCTARPIRKGARIKDSDLVLKRTNATDVCYEMEDIVSKTASRSIRTNTAIRKGDIR